jgi:hypothetical protein
MRLLKWLFRTIVRLAALVLVIPILGFAYGWLTTTDQPPAARSQVTQPAIAEQLREEIPGYQRPEESTFLTYPEWAIVYAARDYAGFVASRSESDFPYLGYVGRFWQDYAIVVRATSGYAFNAENHLMLVAIGTSHTIEHVLQWAWENTAGRLTAWAAGWRKTPQDRFQAAAAAEYAAFLDQVPWYRFPYAKKRAGLWRMPIAEEEAAIRSWERRLAFGLSHTIKQAYADLIASGLAATSEAAESHIFVWAQGPVPDAIRGLPDTALERRLGADGTVFVTRRYQAFTDLLPRLVEKGVRFVEIGGNRDILLTVLSKEVPITPFGVRQLFTHTLPADRSRRRTGFIVPVSSLHVVLPLFASAGARLEHVYDY